MKALILIELVKRKVGEIYSYDLHQQNKIYSMEIVSYEESKVEGMEKIETRRRVTAMDTILSKDMLDEADPGYQFCKPEPKEEGAAANSNQNNTKKEGGNFRKKVGRKGPKVYNKFDDDDDKDNNDKDKKDGDPNKGGKQRRGGDKDKHEQDRDGKDAKLSRRDKKKGGNKDKDEGESKTAGRESKRQPKKSRRENLRNLINDDEVYPRPMDARGGGRRGRGRGDFNRDEPGRRGMDREFNQGPRGGRPEPGYRGGRDDRGPRPYPDGPPRSNDDFHVRPHRGRGGDDRGRGDRGDRRRGGMMPSDRYGGGDGPPRGQYYDRERGDPYAQ